MGHVFFYKKIVDHLQDWLMIVVGKSTVSYLLIPPTQKLQCLCVRLVSFFLKRSTQWGRKMCDETILMKQRLLALSIYLPSIPLHLSVKLSIDILSPHTQEPVSVLLSQECLNNFTFLIATDLKPTKNLF